MNIGRQTKFTGLAAGLLMLLLAVILGDARPVTETYCARCQRRSLHRIIRPDSMFS